MLRRKEGGGENLLVLQFSQIKTFCTLGGLVSNLSDLTFLTKQLSLLIKISVKRFVMPPKKKNDIKAAKAAKALAPKDPPAAVDPPKPAGRGKRGAPVPDPDPVPPAPTKKGSKQKEPEPAPQPAKKGRGKKDAPVADAPAPAKDELLVKVVTKGGAAVDSLVPNHGDYRVYQDGGVNYSATMNQANMDANNNKFYIAQVLLNEKSGQIFVWNRWGRVGVPGQNCMYGPFTKDVALGNYNKKVHEKTVKGDYRLIQIKYDDDEPKPAKEETKKPKKANTVASKMDSGLQKLISLIFDVNIMQTTMKEIGYDAKKMPLGKLGDNTIKEAYKILAELTKAIKENKTSEYSRLSGDFFSLIPHDFGFQKMANFVMRNDEQVKEKLRMLEAISDMKITTKLLDQDGDDDTAVLDQNYKKLGCEIKTLPTSGADYKLLKEYFDHTKGSGFSRVTVGDIYEVDRASQTTNFRKELGNNMLLWHGSRITNFVGILSQGLRIAPPEAPVSGYLFGKGIYLADLAEKSIHYCRSHGSQKALILLIEGALGEPNILLTSSSQAKELMERNGRHSTKCHGAKAPPESCYVNFKNMIVPNGPAVPTGSGSYMGHNEFIVYNINQARIRYIIEMNMNGN